MDLRPLANKLNAWLKGEGRAILASKLGESGQIELLSFQDGGFRKTYLLTSAGICVDYYPVTQPKRRGEELTLVHDSLHFLEALVEKSDHRSPEAIMSFWEKLGVMR